MHVEPQVLDRDVREGDRLVGQVPIPVKHEIGHQLGQAESRQLDTEAQIGLHAKVNDQRGLGVGHQLVQRQAAGRIALQVYVQVPDQATALETGFAEVAVFVGDHRCEEQQLAAA